MFKLFYDYFNNIVFGVSGYLSGATFTIGGASYTLGQWLSITSAIICTILVFVVCCLFVWKLAKIVGRLFTGR